MPLRKWENRSTWFSGRKWAMTRGDGASRRTSRTALELRNSIHSVAVSRRMSAGSESMGTPRFLAPELSCRGLPEPGLGGI